MEEYRVSLKHPNKRYALPQADCKRRIVQFIKNVWRVRHFFYKKFEKDPSVVSGDQMPLHPLESQGQRTMAMSSEDCHTKENYMHGHERVTVFTQMSSDGKAAAPKPEFVFKGKGVRVKLNPPRGIIFQWSDSGSYRVAHVLKTIAHLPTVVGPMERYTNGGLSKFKIYTLDNYSCHLDPSVYESLYKKGYIFIPIGGGITGDCQVNNTALHHHLKIAYRALEQVLLVKKLSQNIRVPSITRDKQMELMDKAWEQCEANHKLAFKTNWLTNSFDGSEDHLVSSRIMDLVGEELIAFRTELLESEPAADLKELIASLTPPEGVKCREHHGPRDTSYIDEEVPIDEGEELLDCDGDEVDPEVILNMLTTPLITDS